MKQQFPIYLRSKDSTVYYSISGESSFKQLKRLGTLIFRNEVIDGDFADRIYITDLLEALEKMHLVQINASQFESIDSQAISL